ncbi:glycoside hydrolase family 108 protein [Shinella zoogloeoides]|uniref:glycoside hydrolase family 108 protein n=1 Tax=Shinella zoogloeoides TaxID=352475 RepID=UPI0028A7DBED|nr:glycosyl hydrolase 108 family protein [Shinella zoogloeoides]
MPDRFSICHAITAGHEGLYSNHKDDPGGATMKGVTQAKFTEWLKRRGKPSRNVKTITDAEVLTIYREDYWNPTVEKYHLVPGVDLATYDAAVNSGVSRGIKWLKASVGSSDHSVTVRKICRARLSFMQALKIWKTFGKGWGRRVADIEVKGVAMALAFMGVSDARIRADAAAEAEAANKAAKTADATAKTTGGAGATAGGGAAVDAGGMDAAALWVLGGIAAIAIVVALILYVKKRAHDARAQAYAGAAA